MQDEGYHYMGSELELFAAAKNWKKYVARFIKPYIQGDVLEAGAGIGTNTLLFFNSTVSSWVLLEPDQQNCQVLEGLSAAGKLPANSAIIKGYTSDLEVTEKFDTIIYIDVIEHIEDDKSEIAKATSLLKKNGHLIVLSPAHNYLMSPFDKAIGHFRRYSKKTLVSLADERLQLIEAVYLDSIGLFASLANKYFLKQPYPRKKQIDFWNKRMIPISKIIDPFFLYRFGKTIIAVWKKK